MSTASPASAGGRRRVLGIDVQPDDEYFDVMADASATHWWYVARRIWLAQWMRDRMPPGGVLIDVGTGTGHSLATMRAIGAGLAAGTDLSMHALRYAHHKSPPEQVLAALAEHLPFPDDVADALVSMDVIEHLDDDVVALREYRRVLKPGGTLLVTVPSYQWLWAEYDERAAHRCRYNATMLRESVVSAGFVVDTLSYYYSFLVPPAALVRRTPIGRLLPTDTEEEASSVHPAIDAVFLKLSQFERWMARKGLPIPFGLSIYCVAHRPS